MSYVKLNEIKELSFMSVEIKDKKGRVVLHMSKKGKLALSRYDDLSKVEKDKLVDLYCELDSDAIPQEIKDFLNFEEQEEKFCS